MASTNATQLIIIISCSMKKMTLFDVSIWSWPWITWGIQCSYRCSLGDYNSKVVAQLKCMGSPSHWS
jgi:hypothetical protein